VRASVGRRAQAGADVIVVVMATPGTMATTAAAGGST